MFRKSFVCLLAALCLFSGTAAVFAVEVDCDATYCFRAEDFSAKENLAGICITDLPETSAGTVMLGSRVLQPGDILTVKQLEQVTFSPVYSQESMDAVMTYLPIYADRVESEASVTVSVRGKMDKAPVAEDFTVETYKNLPNEGKLKVFDPEEGQLTYTVGRQPRRGSVELRDDGSFLYTPKKNKVGVDSFTYTATDPAGNVSREATVTVQILKPTDSAQYTDTVDLSCRFEAEWLRNTGLFEGEKINGQECFYPDRAVSKGQFLAMVMQLLEIPVEQQATYTGMAEEAPDWLKPYLAAAMRTGLLAGWPESVSFTADAPITGAEAAVLLHNALDLPAVQQTAQVNEDGKTDLPTWADTALGTMNENGFDLAYDQTLTRGQMAELLYRLHAVAQDAPGMMVFRAAE